MTTWIRAWALTATAALAAGCGDRDSDTAQGADSQPAVVESAMAKPQLPRTDAPEGARVFFLELADGAVVTSPLTVRFAVENITVVPAGDDQPSSGHHHLLIDTVLPDFGLPIPKDEQHVHFGGGQTETVLELAPGEHTLQLLLGDHLHIPHQPPIYSEAITITVSE
ncbi:MAG: DUF4399 domain-containing protein [Pseudomonadota bacterium]